MAVWHWYCIDVEWLYISSLPTQNWHFDSRLNTWYCTVPVAKIQEMNKR